MQDFYYSSSQMAINSRMMNLAYQIIDNVVCYTNSNGHMLGKTI